MCSNDYKRQEQQQPLSRAWNDARENVVTYEGCRTALFYAERASSAFCEKGNHPEKAAYRDIASGQIH